MDRAHDEIAFRSVFVPITVPILGKHIPDFLIGTPSMRRLIATFTARGIKSFGLIDFEQGIRVCAAAISQLARVRLRKAL